MSRKKPTIKELNKIVLDNRHGIEVAFKNVEEIRYYLSGLDRLFDWYVEFKKDTDEFKKFIEENKAPKEDSNSDGVKDSVSDKQQDLPEEKSGKGVSEEPK